LYRGERTLSRSDAYLSGPNEQVASQTMVSAGKADGNSQVEVGSIKGRSRGFGMYATPTAKTKLVRSEAFDTRRQDR
jgi:hypothetical protein